MTWVLRQPAVFPLYLLVLLRAIGWLDWSWIKVTAPLWFPPACAVSVVLVLWLLLAAWKIFFWWPFRR